MDCINSVGRALPMRQGDFVDFRSFLSQGKVSKDSRPRLDDVVALQFRIGEPYLFFKTAHTDTDFKKADLLTNPAKKLVLQKNLLKSQAAKSCGSIITADRKNGIIEKLTELMPVERRQFWLDL